MIPRNQIEENDTMHCTERETWSCHFPGNAFSKVWKQKKGQSTVNEQRPNRDCALQTGPITWTLGAKGVVLLLRLWLWISKIKQQKKKKRKCNKNQNPTKQQQKLTIHSQHNRTLYFQRRDLGQWVHSYFTFSSFTYICFSESFVPELLCSASPFLLWTLYPLPHLPASQWY